MGPEEVKKMMNECELSTRQNNLVVLTRVVTMIAEKLERHWL